MTRTRIRNLSRLPMLRDAETPTAELSTQAATRTEEHPAPVPRRARSLVPAAILAVPVVLIGLSFWPGHMSADTLAQIDQVDAKSFTNWHAPLLLAGWSLVFDLGVGPGWVLAAQLLTFMTGAYLVLRAAFRPVAAAVLTALIALSPPVFGMLGYLSRDTCFMALLLLTFGLIVRATQRSWPGRRACLLLALGAAWLTLATRQNAAAAVVLACIVIAGLALERWSGDRPLRVLAAVAVGFILTLALMGTQLAASAAIGVHDADPEQTLFMYDVGAISARERENLFPRDVLPQRGTAVIDGHYNVDSMLAWAYIPDAPIKLPLSKETVQSLRDGWWEAVREHPLAYLDTRWDLFLRQIGVTRDAMWVYHPVVDPNNRGFVVKFPELNGIARDYEEAFANPALDGGPVFTVWAYLLVALVGAIALLRRGRSWALLTVGALSLAALTYQIGLFFGAMGTQYRFETASVAIGLISAAVLVQLALRWRAHRRAGTSRNAER